MIKDLKLHKPNDQNAASLHLAKLKDHKPDFENLKTPQ